MVDRKTEYRCGEQGAFLAAKATTMSPVSVQSEGGVPPKEHCSTVFRWTPNPQGRGKSCSTDLEKRVPGPSSAQQETKKRCQAAAAIGKAHERLEFSFRERPTERPSFAGCGDTGLNPSITEAEGP